MIGFIRFQNLFSATLSRRSLKQNPYLVIFRVSHFGPKVSYESSDPNSSSVSKTVGNVAIFSKISPNQNPSPDFVRFSHFGSKLSCGSTDPNSSSVSKTVGNVVIFSRRPPNQNPSLTSVRFSHFGSKLGCGSSDPNSTSVSNTIGNVAIFWDLDNKPPNSFPPFDAAIRLKKAASSFGFVRYMLAYANRHAFSYVPTVVREQRKERKALNQLENRRIIKPTEPYLCRVCGRKFYTNEKLVNHFKQIHEREHTKRLNRLESVKGNRRVELVAKFSMKMEKYKKAARDVLTPKVGYGLADELKRAGFWVRLVSDKPQAADIGLRNHMVELMDQRRVECLFVVSDDSDFVDVLKEAKMRCLKTVVVGDSNDGALKRCADVGFSWKEIMLGKAKKEAVSVLGRWKDRDVLKRLEWTYKPELEKREDDCDDSEFESEDEGIENSFPEEEEDVVKKEDVKPWWELDSE